MTRRLWLLLLIAGGMTCRAGINTFTPIGPPGGHVTALAVDSASPSVVYAAVEKHTVLRSTDGGQHWEPRSHGMFGSETVQLLADAPSNEGTLYVCTDSPYIYRTTDGGANWTRATNGLPGSGQEFYALAVDPASPERVYVSVKRSPFRGVYRTSNGGQSWEPANAGLGVLPDALLSPEPNTVYASATSGVYKTVNGASDWQKVGSGLPEFLATTHLAANAAGMLFLNNDAQIYSSTTQGDSWQESALLPKPVTALLADPVESLVYAGTDGAGVFASTDESITFTAIHGNPAEGGLWDLRITALTVRPASIPSDEALPDLFAGTQDDGLSYTFKLRTGSYWSDWTPVEKIWYGDFRTIEVDPANPNHYLAGTSSQLWNTEDAGLTWTVVLPPKPLDGTNSAFVRDIAFSQVTPGQVLLSLSPDEGVQGYAPGMYRSDDGGANWYENNNGLPETWIEFVNQVEPLADGTYMLARPPIPDATHCLGYQPQFDAWHPLDGDYDGELDAQAMVSGSEPYPNTVLVAGAGQAPNNVFITHDAGTSWQPYGQGLEQVFYVYSIVIDPTHTGAILSTNQGVYVRLFNDSDWTKAVDLVHGPAIAGANGRYAVLYQGNVWSSPDGGLDWFEGQTFPNSCSWDLAFDPVRNVYLAAGCDDGIGEKTDDPPVCDRYELHPSNIFGHSEIYAFGSNFKDGNRVQFGCCLTSNTFVLNPQELHLVIPQSVAPGTTPDVVLRNPDGAFCYLGPVLIPTPADTPTPTVSGTTPTPTLPVSASADLNHDHIVDGKDLLQFIGGWNNSRSGYDLNGSGGVNGVDVFTFSRLWLQQTGAAF